MGQQALGLEDTRVSSLAVLYSCVISPNLHYINVHKLETEGSGVATYTERTICHKWCLEDTRVSSLALLYSCVISPNSHYINVHKLVYGRCCYVHRTHHLSLMVSL